MAVFLMRIMWSGDFVHTDTMSRLPVASLVWPNQATSNLGVAGLATAACVISLPGRPVLVQDTGVSAYYRLGAGC